MKIALLQRNYTVADLEGNAARISEATRQAQERGASLVVTSELALLGYPTRDLLLHPAFVTRRVKKKIARRVTEQGEFGGHNKAGAAVGRCWNNSRRFSAELPPYLR